MPLWFVVFISVWSVVSVILAVIVGAFLAYCKETKANPLTQVKYSLFTPPEPPVRKQDEEVKGFYE